MDFLVELSCVIRRLDEPTFTDYHDSIPLFVKDNPALGTKWYEFLEKIHVKPKNESKKWRQILREIRYWKDQELDHMYQRIMRVSRQVMGKIPILKPKQNLERGLFRIEQQCLID